MAEPAAREEDEGAPERLVSEETRSEWESRERGYLDRINGLEVEVAGLRTRVSVLEGRRGGSEERTPEPSGGEAVVRAAEPSRSEAAELAASLASREEALAGLERRHARATSDLAERDARVAELTSANESLRRDLEEARAEAARNKAGGHKRGGAGGAATNEIVRDMASVNLSGTAPRRPGEGPGGPPSGKRDDDARAAGPDPASSAAAAGAHRAVQTDYHGYVPHGSHHDGDAVVADVLPNSALGTLHDFENFLADLGLDGDE